MEGRPSFAYVCLLDQIAHKRQIHDAIQVAIEMSGMFAATEVLTIPLVFLQDKKLTVIEKWSAVAMHYLPRGGLA